MKLGVHIDYTRIDENTVEIRLYIGDQLLNTSRFFADATQKLLMKEFHPKCKTCEYWGDALSKADAVKKPCTATRLDDYYGHEETEHDHYCASHPELWEAK